MYWWLDSRGSGGPRQSHGTAGWRAGQAVTGSVQWSPDKKGNGPSKPRGAVSFAKEIDTLARLAIFYLVAAAAGGSAAAGLAGGLTTNRLTTLRLAAATKQTGFGTRGGQGEESEGQQEGCTDALDHEEDS